MWYDKQRKEFHIEDRDVEDVAAKLRYMANRIEDESWGCLTLNALGDIFGNEFWNLVYDDMLQVADRRNMCHTLK